MEQPTVTKETVIVNKPDNTKKIVGIGIVSAIAMFYLLTFASNISSRKKKRKNR